MGKIASRNLNLTLNAVALEDELNSASLNVTQETPDATAFADAGPRVVTANYGYSADISGYCDFVASQGDATLFGLIGSSGVSMGLDPTGVTAGTDDPNYDATVCLSSYTLTFQQGNAAAYSANLVGNSALVRATS